MDDDEIFDRYEQELVWMIGQAGGVNALGRAMGISPSTISRWLHRNRKPSAYHAIAIETYTNGDFLPWGHNAKQGRHVRI